MTRRALRIEERLARLRIADEDARRPHARLIIAGCSERVDERGEIRELIVGERKFRHAAIDAAVADDGADELAALIVQYQP